MIEDEWAALLSADAGGIQLTQRACVLQVVSSPVMWQI
jgi:hypothetical protein